MIVEMWTKQWFLHDQNILIQNQKGQQDGANDLEKLHEKCLQVQTSLHQY
jgi:hypothetical protein